MSIKQYPKGLELDFGSTVTILTTAVADIKHCKRVSGQGIFTGVVLEESEIRLKRSPKHVLISMNGLGEFQGGTESKGEDSCWNEHKCDSKQDEGHKPHCEKDHGGHKNDCECEVKTTQEFVILSLTCPSFPFISGQIVWISLDQIVALAVLCRE